MPSRASVILHPIRIRVVQALAGAELTPLQVAEQLVDVPQASLYRHIARLTEAGIIRVVSQRRVRGTTEHVYTLAEAGNDQLQAFTTFLATLLGDFNRYAGGDAGTDGDAVGYQQVELNLDDAEFEVLLHTVGSAIVAALENEPRPGRRKRLLTTIVLPGE
jgi:DNA-binding transcriptional ArsR family regulator